MASGNDEMKSGTENRPSLAEKKNMLPRLLFEQGLPFKQHQGCPPSPPPPPSRNCISPTRFTLPRVLPYRTTVTETRSEDRKPCAFVADEKRMTDGWTKMGNGFSYLPLCLFAYCIQEQ